jgi:hypothetical protein
LWNTGSKSSGGRGDVVLGSWSETDVELDFVILESNKWKSKTWVSVEPELKRNVKSSRWNTSVSCGSWSSKSGSVTSHYRVSIFVFSGLGKFIPDVEPVTIMSVNFLSTDFNVDVVND